MISEMIPDQTVNVKVLSLSVAHVVIKPNTVVLIVGRTGTSTGSVVQLSQRL